MSPARRWLRRLPVAVVGLILTLAALALMLRFGPLTPLGRSVAEGALDHASAGRYGRIHVEGLRGDLWGDFSIRQLTISDVHGVWADADDVHIRWNWTAALSRTVDIDQLAVGRIALERRPTPTRVATGGGSPVSLMLRRIDARVATLPAFSGRPGLYDVAGRIALDRDGDLDGRLAASSLTHAGDFAAAEFDLGGGGTVRLRLAAREAEGGALAGSIGLAADQPFLVSATADGTTRAGRFEVSSRSGPLVPLLASGAWTPDGGWAEGRITLAASSLLSGYRSWLGPQVAFTLEDRRRSDGLDDLDVDSSSENVQLAARGRADLKRLATAPEGLELAVVVRQARRLIGWPDMGSGRFDGVLTGEPTQWRMVGRGSIDGPNGLGYRLASVAGPVRLDWRAGAFDLQAAVDGAGGQGSGVVAALLGARPHAEARLGRGSDGRLLIRSLTLTGPGLKVVGAGSRGLFGGLGFSGQASFSNFALAHPGARGLMSARWSASRAGNSPWTVSVGARATGFSSGIGALDRLVGAAPTLRAAGVWDGRAFQLAAATLGGTAGQATARGAVGGDGSLLLKVAWQGGGALQAGPLTISGPMTGSGAVTGWILSPKLDLAGAFAAFDVPQLKLTGVRAALKFDATSGAGALGLAAASAYGPARLATAFHLTSDGVALSGLDAWAGGVDAAGSVALGGASPWSADLTLKVAPGVLLTRGTAAGRLVIADAPGGPRGRLAISADDAVTRLGGVIAQKAALTADGPLANMPYRLEGSGFSPHGSWRTEGSGVARSLGGSYQISYQGDGRLRNIDFKTLRPAVLTLDSRTRSLSVLAEVGGGRAEVEARQLGQSLEVKAKLADVGLGLLGQDYDGRLDGELTLAGQGPTLGGTLLGRLTGAGERGDGGGIDGQIKVQLAGGAVTLDSAFLSQQGLTSHVHLVLPAEASAAPFRLALVPNRPLEGQFAADGEIGPLWRLAVGGDRTLTGRVHVNAALDGVLSDPEARGEARLSDGVFSDAGSGLKLTHVALDARLDQGSVNVVQFAASDGAAGVLGGSGRFSLARGGASSFRLALQKFRLLDNDLASAVASGQAVISRGADGAVKINGALTVDHAEIAANPPTPSGATPMDVIEIHRQPGVGGGLETSSSRGPSVGVDVTLRAARGIFLKGRGLEAELSLDAHVTGSTAAPQLTGTARMVHGVYDLAGKRFQFDTASVVYLASDPSLIRLDLTAARADPSLTAVVHVEGVATRPKIVLSSTPALPTDEVLSQVLFGTSASQLSPTAAAELASAITTMGGGGGFDVTANLRAFAHLDRLALGGDTAGAIVSGGKYVTSKVYVEVAGGANGPAGSVEWRALRSLSVISRVAGPGGDSQVSVRWRKDY